MPLLDKNTFLNNIQNIFHICLVTVHSELMKKNHKEYLYIDQVYSHDKSVKSLNIRQSIRKKNLLEKDPLLQVDVHQFFVESFNVIKICLIF